jgi:hypothetical protein
MPDSDVDPAFEQRLARVLRVFADEGVGSYDAVETTQIAVQRRAPPRAARRDRPGWLWAALVAGVLVLLLGAIGLTGGFISLTPNAGPLNAPGGIPGTPTPALTLMPTLTTTTQPTATAATEPPTRSPRATPRRRTQQPTVAPRTPETPRPVTPTAEPTEQPTPTTGPIPSPEPIESLEPTPTAEPEPTPDATPEPSGGP